VGAFRDPRGSHTLGNLQHNQEAGPRGWLPQNSGIWPDVQSAGVLLRSHKIQDSHSSHRMEKEIRRYMLDEGWIHGEQ
jgi:hypothetical protein